MATAEGLAELYEAVHTIKHLERPGWILKGVQAPRDTVASHSYGAALLGWIRATEEGLDAFKVVRMLLLHDLMESIIGDITPHEMSADEHRSKEDAGFAKLAKLLPGSIRNEATELFSEFQERATPEARVAKECDKLDTLFQAMQYGKTMPGTEQEFLETYSGVFTTEEGKRYYHWIRENASRTE